MSQLFCSAIACKLACFVCDWSSGIKQFYQIRDWSSQPWPWVCKSCADLLRTGLFWECIGLPCFKSTLIPCDNWYEHYFWEKIFFFSLFFLLCVTKSQFMVTMNEWLLKVLSLAPVFSLTIFKTTASFVESNHLPNLCEVKPVLSFPASLRLMWSKYNQSHPICF